MDSPYSVSASSQFGRSSRSTHGGGRNTFMIYRSKTHTVGSQSADFYPAVFSEHGEPSPTARCEMDTRADTVCAGVNFIHLFHHGTECDVSGYSDELGTMKNIPVVTFAKSIYDLSTHNTHSFIFTFALYFVPKIKQSLICLNQCREGGTIIEECPHKFNPASKHGLTTPDQSLCVPFQIHGQTSYLLSRKPT
jgi:hypothetical protein